MAVHLFIDRRLELNLFFNVIMKVWRNCQVWSEQTSDSSAFLNTMSRLKYVVNCERHFPYFDPDYPTSGLNVIGLSRVYCICFAQCTNSGGHNEGRITRLLTFRNWSVTLRSLYGHSLDRKCLRMSAAAYSMYSHLSSIAGGRFLHPQSEDVPCRGDKGPKVPLL
jgi:hypothetical protein